MKTGCQSYRPRGFSLLELLVVMAIMGLLSTLAVTGYFSAVRGMLKQRAGTAVQNTLVLARQRACTDGSKTSVVFFNVWSGAEQNKSGPEKWKAARPSYVVCKAIGQFTYVKNNLLGDEFSPLDRLFDLVDEGKVSSTAPIRVML